MTRLATALVVGCGRPAEPPAVRPMKAADATGERMEDKGMADAAPAEFRADRPFLFLIRDARTGRVAFLGRLAEPGE